MPVDFLAVLPPEVAVGILSCGELSSLDVRHVAPVSKTWAQMAHYPALWRTLALRWGLAVRPRHGGKPTLKPRVRNQLASLLNSPHFSDNSLRGQEMPPRLDWRIAVSLMDLQSVQRTGWTLNGQALDIPALRAVRKTHSLPAPDANGILPPITNEHDSQSDYGRFNVLSGPGLVVSIPGFVGNLSFSALDGSGSYSPPHPVTAWCFSRLLEADAQWIVFQSENALLQGVKLIPYDPRNKNCSFLNSHWGVTEPKLVSTGMRPGDEPRLFRLKGTILACLGMMKYIYFWDIEKGEMVHPPVYCIHLPILTFHHMDFDADHVFVTGMLMGGLTDVQAISRHNTDRRPYAWSLTTGVVSHCSDRDREDTSFPTRRTMDRMRTYMRLHFPHWKCGSVQDPGPGVPGYYHAVIQPLWTMRSSDPITRVRSLKYISFSLNFCRLFPQWAQN